MQTNFPADSLMLRLRSETAEIHRKTEDSFNLAASVSSVEAYRETLLAFAAVFLPLEARLEELSLWQALGLKSAEFSRSEALIRDLNALGIHSPPEPVSAEWIDSLSMSVGVAYVLEGSRLGGQIIAAQIRKNLAIGSKAVAFFAGNGQATKRLWQSFARAVDSYPNVDRQQAVEGAQVTFRLLQQRLQARANYF